MSIQSKSILSLFIDMQYGHMSLLIFQPKVKVWILEHILRVKHRRIRDSSIGWGEHNSSSEHFVFAKVGYPREEASNFGIRAVASSKGYEFFLCGAVCVGRSFLHGIL